MRNNAVLSSTRQKYKKRMDGVDEDEMERIDPTEDVVYEH